MHIQRITVCGGGNGAQTLASIASQNLGCAVNVYAPFQDEAERLRRGIDARGGIETTGAVAGLGRPHDVSADAADVVPGSELVVLVVPAFAHESTLQAVVPHLDEGAWVGAMPSRGGLDYCAVTCLEAAGRTDVTVFGLQTLPWACRIQEYGRVVKVLGVKRTVDVACRPANRQNRVAPLLEQMLGVPTGDAGNMLALTLANTGQIIHPGIMYDLFADWDGRTFEKENIPLFYQGLSHDGARILSELSHEIQRICTRLASYPLDLSGVHDLKTWLVRSYGDAILDTSSLHSAFVTNKAYAGLTAPVKEVEPGQFAPLFGARYLAEDVPYGLAVSQAIARLASVETPTMDKVVSWARGTLQNKAGGDDTNDRTPQAFHLDNLDALIKFTLQE